MANCLRCKAKCAVHALKVEAEAMKGRESIDCETFEPVTIDDTLAKAQEEQEILTIMRGVRRNLESMGHFG